MSGITPRAVGALLAMGALLGTANAATLTLNPVADTFVRFGINQNVNYGTNPILDIYQVTTIRAFYAYVRFDLSTLPAGATIDSATLTFFKGTGGTRSDVLNTGRFAAYGLLDVAGNTPQNWGETTLVFSGGSENVGSEYITNSGTQFDTATRTVSFDGIGETAVDPNYASIAGASGGPLVTFLSDRSTAGGSTTFIVDIPTADNGRGYALGSRENTNTALIPVLQIEYTPIPEPTGLVAIGSLVGLGLRRSRNRRI